MDRESQSDFKEQKPGLISTVKGSVFGDEPDQDDNPTVCGILTQDGEEFVVLPESVAKQLLSKRGAWVSITGVLGKSKDGDNTITAHRFEEIKAFSFAR